MPERTHLSEPDEALRRAKLDDLVCAGLRVIVDRLTQIRPTDPMTEDRRMALALRQAVHALGHTDAAQELERHFLARMPQIDRHRPISRGEYALLLRQAAGSR